MAARTKWVLIVNINPGGIAGGSGAQYFVGDFDGTTFTRRQRRGAYTPPAGELFEDFEGATTATGRRPATRSAAGPRPATCRRRAASRATSATGLANSFHDDDSRHGHADLADLHDQRAPYLNFLVGGGNHPHDPDGWRRHAAARRRCSPTSRATPTARAGRRLARSPARGRRAARDDRRPAAGQRLRGQPAGQHVHRPDNGTGHITSPEFTITTRLHQLPDRGRNHPYPGDARTRRRRSTCRRRPGRAHRDRVRDGEALNWTNWNVNDLNGKTARDRHRRSRTPAAGATSSPTSSRSPTRPPIRARSRRRSTCSSTATSCAAPPARTARRSTGRTGTCAT